MRSSFFQNKYLIYSMHFRGHFQHITFRRRGEERIGATNQLPLNINFETSLYMKILSYLAVLVYA